MEMGNGYQKTMRSLSKCLGRNAMMGILTVMMGVLPLVISKSTSSAEVVTNSQRITVRIPGRLELRSL